MNRKRAIEQLVRLLAWLDEITMAKKQQPKVKKRGG